MKIGPEAEFAAIAKAGAALELIWATTQDKNAMLGVVNALGAQQGPIAQATATSIAAVLAQHNMI